MEERSFEGFLADYDTHLDDPEWLSTAIIKLAAILYTNNIKMAQAELAESQMMVGFFSEIKDGKKMAVSEAEVRAQAATSNLYHQYKVTGEAIVETINAIKQRITVLSWERKSPHYG